MATPSRRPSYLVRFAACVLAALVVSGCDVTATTRVICRGDSVRADHADTALVRCAVLDSLATR